MAHKLADELLALILAPHLTIPDSQFASSFPASFGRNDNVSSSTVLAVCKRWMRVATPLLYEVIVLRSIGQAHALADAFKANPDFGQHVKKIRLEGAYSRLFEVFKRCTRLHSLFFIMTDIMSADNANALCRSLSIINPTRVIFVDTDNTDFQGDNANKRKLFLALCVSIPSWTNLREFHYPYSHNPFIMTPAFEMTDSRRNRLAIALKSSPSLEEVHAETPYTWDSVWSRLAADGRLHFYLDMEPPVRSGYDRFLNTINSKPDVKQLITFKSRPFATANATSSFFTPLASTDPVIADKIWNRIFAFALLPGHPDETELSDAIHNTNFLREEMISARDTISLVSRKWHRILDDFFLSAPLFTSPEALESFTDRILVEPALGEQVLTISLHALRDIPEDHETILCALFPRLTRLRCFIGFEDWSMSYAAFESLAYSAGNTLTTLLNVDIDHEGVSPAIFDSLKRVEELQLRSFPLLSHESNPVRDGCLATVQSLTFSEMSPCPAFFASLSFPCLVKVKFARATFRELTFLESCGSRVIDLEVEVYNNPHEDCDVELLRPCFNLKTLRLESPYELHCPKFIANSSGNDTLQHILISAMLGYPGDKIMAGEIERFFATFPFQRFPKLRNIEFTEYQWPVLHRDIDREYLIKVALSLKEQYGVTITDETGKPFRPRVQRRRRR